MRSSCEPSRRSARTSRQDCTAMSDARVPPPDRRLRVLVFAASLRKDSVNAVLARLAARHASRHGAVVDLASMREFDGPSYDPEIDARGDIPAGALELNRRLTANDA